MKKALMVLGFALCTTMAFAQTKADQRNLAKHRAVKPNLNEATEQPVDYKASIFSKDGTFDTVRCFRFNDADMASITYGDIAATDHLKKIDGTDSVFTTTYNTISLRENTWARWRRYRNIQHMKDSIWTDYPTWIARFFCTNPVYNALGVEVRRDTSYDYVIDRFRPDSTIADDGFMFFGYDFNTSLNSDKKVNTYFTLPNVHRSLNGEQHMVLIGVNQCYYKFSDRCFIDYKIGNDWYTREINVYGVDVDINSVAAATVRYTMPFNLANQEDITLRVRVYAIKNATFGYGWFLDNLAVITDNRTQSWSFNTPTTFDGFYGTIPAGMNIPVTYGIHVRNTSSVSLANTTLTLSNAPANGNWSVVASSEPYDVPVGDVEQDYKLWISERGFLHDSSRTAYNYNYLIHGYPWLLKNYGNQGELTGGYQGRGLNTEEAGAHFYTIKAECDSSNGVMTRIFDTVLYTVSNNTIFLNDGDSNRVSGYRWARDNGLVPSGSSFKYAYTNPNQAGNIYYGDDDDAGHSYEPGYEVLVEYVSGNDFPEGYVFRGIEYVPATDMQEPLDMVTENGVLMPLIFEVDEEGDWVELSGGIDNMLFPITEDAVNNLPSTYALNPADYSALNIEFLDEIPLKKNTAYLIGYYLYRSAQFRVAAQRWGYKDGDSTIRYSANETTAPYYRQNTPHMTYDVLVRDAATSRSDKWIVGYNMDYFPMIRPIVGQPSERAKAVVTAECNSNNDTTAIIVTRAADNLCEEDIEVSVGAAVSFDIKAAKPNGVIKKIFVNGIEAQVYDEDNPPQYNFWLYEREDNVLDVYDSSNVILYRNAYTLHFSGMQQYVEGEDDPWIITAEVEWQDFDLTGIDDVAPESYISLSPNPATSTVKLNVAGVSGMLDCSILDMSGRVVYTSTMNAETGKTINVSNLPAGAYFVRVTNDTFNKIEKLIVK